MRARTHVVGQVNMESREAETATRRPRYHYTLTLNVNTRVCTTRLVCVRATAADEVTTGDFGALLRYYTSAKTNITKFSRTQFSRASLTV